MRRPVHRAHDAVRFAAVFTVAVSLLAATRAVPQVTARGAARAAPADSAAISTETLVRELTERGFQVNDGQPLVYRDACAEYSYPALQSCFGNNPVAPYMIPTVKAWPEEFVGPTPVNAFGPVKAGYLPVWRVDPRDAIVIHGRMPPPGKYMSVATYVWTQHGKWNEKDFLLWAATPNHPPMRYVFSTVPANDPKAGRVWSFSSLGDPVNNAVMERTSGSPFGKQRWFIITPSASTDRAVRNVLRARGVPDGDIFTERIPRRDEVGPIGPIGMDENATDFLTFFRYALPDDPAAGRLWWADLEGDDPPLHVLRVRAPSSLGPVERYDLLTYGNRTAVSEDDLATDLQDLVDAVCDRVRGKGLQSTDCVRPPPISSFMADLVTDFGWAGPYCRKVDMWCGDQTDAGLFGTRALPLDSGELYAVVATLATETGNATYVGLSINAASTYLAPAGLVDGQLEGSADAYADEVRNTDKLFVHFFTRRCDVLGDVLPPGRNDCTEIDEGMVPKQGDPDALGDPTLHGMFWPGIRDYLVPGDTHGPDTRKLLRPRILTFTTP